MSLYISCESIEENLKEGRAEGTFTLECPEPGIRKGRLLSSDPRLTLSQEGFQGEITEIGYQFDGTDMEPGEKVSGSVCVLSDQGEYDIPFTFSNTRSVPDSSLGEIRNLFHFTNLARTCWQEAVNLYFSQDFAVVLKNTDREYQEIYRGLSDAPREQYMEEFLLAIHKKTPVDFVPETTKLVLENLSGSVQKELSIEKKGWGYTRLEIEVQGEFFRVEKQLLTEEDFTENTYQLPVLIEEAKLHGGKNLGRLLLHSPYKTVEILLEVHQNGQSQTKAALERRRNRKWLNCKLTELYIGFRSKKISAGRFRKESEEILEGLARCDDRGPLIKLYEAHLYITQEKFHEARWMLDRASKNKEISAKSVIYAYYLYLTTLITEDTEYINQVKNAVEVMYHKYGENWQIAWLWMYLSGELRTNVQKKWNYLTECFRKGCISPVMYTEAVLLLNYQPTLLSELGEAELGILRFGQKKGMLTPELKGIIQYLSSKEKTFTYPVYALLRDICKEEENAEMLQSLCGLLIKGNRIGSTYFDWYEKAIINGCKITRLYEFYMMSLDKEAKTELPRMVLLYFSYQTDLNADYLPRLYRYAHEHREEMEDIYLKYAKTMERFVLKNLHAGKIDSDLAYLYEEIVVPALMTGDNAKALARVMFVHYLPETGQQMARLRVLHQQRKDCRIYEVGNGRAEIAIYTRNYQIFCEDRQGNRFLLRQEKQPEAYMNIRETAAAILPWTAEETGLALYACSGNQDWQNVTPLNESQYQRLRECEEIQPDERMQIRSMLLDYYFENDVLEKLDACLEEYLPHAVAKEERKRFIHYLILRDYYEKAYECTKVYGPEKAEPKDLVRICSQMLEEGKGETKYLLWYIYTAFCRGKYNTQMLQFLVQFYRGSSKNMKIIFRAAAGFDVDTYGLCERLLTQILITGAYIGDESDIFKTYVAGGSQTELERAFLSYRAAAYMEEDRLISPYLILDMGRVYRRGHQLPVVNYLAYLRYFAENKEERKQADDEILRAFLREVVIERNLLLPFLQEYGAEPGMEALADKTLLSYKTEPGSSVILHYAKTTVSEGKEGFVREEMKEVCYGIYVKEFVLFYGEEIQYYITEEQENQEQLTSSGILRKEEDKGGRKDSRYQMLQEMSISRQMEDYSSLDSMLEEYLKMEFITDRVFVL